MNLQSLTPGFMNKTYNKSSSSSKKANSNSSSKNTDINKYTYSPNGTGGVNYFYDGKPITNTQYRNATGNSTDTIEALIKAGYGSNTAPVTAPVTTTSSSISYPDLSGAINILRNNIALLDPIYQSAVSRAIKDYNTANNERIGAYNKTKATSKSSGISNDQSVLNSRNSINKNARMSSENIMSMLNAMGMGGSTINKALGVIADTTNNNLNTANYSYGKNKQSILQAWNDYVNEDANKQKQLKDAKNYAIAQAGISRDTSKKAALEQIAANKVSMGQYNTSDILGEIAATNNDIAKLSNVPTTYTGVTPTYTPPSISSIIAPSATAYGVSSGTAENTTAPKLIKVNDKTSNNDKYGLVA